MSIKACDNLGTDPLIRTDNFSQVLRIELSRQGSGIDQVTEHHRELPSFRVGRRYSQERCDMRGGLCLGSRRLRWLSRLRDEGRCFRSFPSPHQYSAIFIRGELLCLNNLRLEGFEILVI